MLCAWEACCCPPNTCCLYLPGTLLTSPPRVLMLQSVCSGNTRVVLPTFSWSCDHTRAPRSLSGPSGVCRPEYYKQELAVSPTRNMESVVGTKGYLWLPHCPSSPWSPVPGAASPSLAPEPPPPALPPTRPSQSPQGAACLRLVLTEPSEGLTGPCGSETGALIAGGLASSGQRRAGGPL